MARAKTLNGISNAAKRHITAQVLKAGGDPDLAAIEIEMAADALGDYRMLKKNKDQPADPKELKPLRDSIRALMGQIMRQTKCGTPDQEEEGKKFGSDM